MFLTLGPTSYNTNNTEILITDIGQDAVGGGLPTLTCHTDLTTCCRSNADNNGMGGLGQWTYPGGTLLQNHNKAIAASEGFFFVRNGPQLIRLARRDNINPLTPTGSYCCTVPTSLGEMTLCANLGEWRDCLGVCILLYIPYSAKFSRGLIFADFVG